jgi:hypothetical protein
MKRRRAFIVGGAPVERESDMFHGQSHASIGAIRLSLAGERRKFGTGHYQRRSCPPIWVSWLFLLLG